MQAHIARNNPIAAARERQGKEIENGINNGIDANS
jgi:hypothetical protein